MDIKLLSLVVPAYRQEKTIQRDIKRLDKVLSSLPYRYEIIVVVDGFLDKTYEKVASLSKPMTTDGKSSALAKATSGWQKSRLRQGNVGKAKVKSLKLYGYEENQGKGHAIKYGAQKAKGDIIGFIDAGMDIDPAGISMLLNHMIWYDADIIVGSKLHPVSQVDYPFSRKVLSWGYRNLVRVLFGFKVRDTQAGIKLFRRRVVKDVFPRLLVKKFAFDVEILAVSRSLGYKKIYEAPIRLKFKGPSSITTGSFWKIIFLMLWDTAAVFYRIRILNYYDKQ